MNRLLIVTLSAFLFVGLSCSQKVNVKPSNNTVEIGKKPVPPEPIVSQEKRCFSKCVKSGHKENICMCTCGWKIKQIECPKLCYEDCIKLGESKLHCECNCNYKATVEKCKRLRDK